MSTRFQKYEPLIQKAVATYWSTLKSQSEKQGTGKDQGRRAGVTGGQQMNGFCQLVNAVLEDCGLTEAEVHVSKKLELPGYFRPTKEWDMVIVDENRLIAALEFKSQRGPSFGNNFNNRSEEIIGVAHDFRTAHREGAFGKDAPRPWIGWVTLLEDCPASTRAVRVSEPHYSVFAEFKDASYARRYELLLRKLVSEQLYNSTAFLMATDEGGPQGRYSEPAKDLRMNTLLASLAGHVGEYLESR